jgi:hypothetical protein
VNDLFGIVFNDDALVIDVRGWIYDRWGGLVFEDKGLPFTWNGFEKNEALNPGVFLYRIEITYETVWGRTSEVVTGDVTLLR